MANIFISHSSSDKQFVRKLATKLLSRGYPVWLDSWEMSIGDSLYDRIYDGLESSSIVLLIISEFSIESGWVSKEINAALIKEEQTGRKLLLPVLLGECEPPLKVADRIYVNFSKSFSEPFSELCLSMDALGVRDIEVSPDRELVVLDFEKDAYLEKSTLHSNLDHARSRNSELIITPAQLVVSASTEYRELLQRLHHRIDDIENDSYYSPELSDSLRTDIERITLRERSLLQGVALMINKRTSLDAIYWFCLILRGQILYSLYSTQNPDCRDALMHGREWWPAHFSMSSDAAKFFGIDEISIACLWPKDDDTLYSRFWIDPKFLRTPIGKENIYQEVASEVVTDGALNKFILPQCVYRRLILDSNTDIPWSPSDFIISVERG